MALGRDARVVVCRGGRGLGALAKYHRCIKWMLPKCARTSERRGLGLAPTIAAVDGSRPSGGHFGGDALT